MRKTLTSTAAAAVAGLLLAVGPTAHASPDTVAAAASGKALAAAAWRTAAGQPTFAALTYAALASPAARTAPTNPWYWPPPSMHALVPDLRAVLHHAGFHLTAGVGGKPPAQMRYVREFDRLSFVAPGERLLAEQVGLDPIYDYLSTALQRWAGEHRAGSLVWTWRDPAADESVTLRYAGPAHGERAHQRPRAELIIIHYTPPREYATAAALAPGVTQAASGQVPTSSRRIATLLERALHRASFVRVSDRRLIAADGRLLKDVRRYASPASACSRAFYLPPALSDPRVTTTPGPAWGTVSWRARGSTVALYLDSSRCPAGGWRAQLTILKHAGR
jgi:hypothetical protein